MDRRGGRPARASPALVITSFLFRIGLGLARSLDAGDAVLDRRGLLRITARQLHVGFGQDLQEDGAAGKDKTRRRQHWVRLRRLPFRRVEVEGVEPSDAVALV